MEGSQYLFLVQSIENWSIMIIGVAVGATLVRENKQKTHKSQFSSGLSLGNLDKSIRILIASMIHDGIVLSWQ